MTTRRDFLHAGALGTALVLGVRRSPKGFRVAKPAERFAPSIWIAIDEQGATTLAIGKQEMGQGVRTSLAMILADELDADWSKVELRQASTTPGFSNLNTGGSWSIGGSWRPLREAAAAARAMLVSAAAAQWGVDPSSCATAAGSVRHATSGRSLPYGRLVAAAAALPVPARAPTKRAADRRLIGTRVKRLDAPSIVTGQARYGIDVRVPGMRFATVARSPSLGARLASFDPRAALQIRGMREVVPITSGLAFVADSTWAALKGRRAIVPRWTPGPDAEWSSARHVQELERALTTPGVVTRQYGSLIQGPVDWKILEARYYYPFEAHAPVEPMNCVAQVTEGRCELWVPTQAPNRAQAQVAELLGIAPSAVVVHPTLIGGGFGRRLGVDYALEAAELSRAIKAPVQVLWTREDDMAHGHFQNASVHDLRGAVDAAGKGLAWRHRKAAALHNLSGPPTAEELRDPVAYYQDSSWGAYDIPYAFPNLETSYHRVDVPVKIGPWRAVYSPSSTFARECFLDELAALGGQDPLAFRLALLEGPDQVRAGGLTIDRSRLRRVLELVRERSGWGGALPAGQGRGVACNVYDGDTHIAYVAEVSLPARPRANYLPFTVHRMVCAVDCGVVINPLGLEQQVEGAVLWALSNLKSEISFAHGRAEQTNYLDFPVARMSETPAVEVHIVPSHGEQPFGMGEPPVPPAVPAIVNALFAATGKRIRRLPIRAADLSP